MRDCALLFTILTLSLSSGPALAPAGAQPARHAERITCAGGRQFLLRLDGTHAQIQIGTQQLDLPRKPSSLSERYDNSDATLMLDGDFVAFVPRGDAGWQDCRRSKVLPAASRTG